MVERIQPVSQSISPTRKGLVYIPNWKGAMQKAWIRALYQKRPKKMPGALTLPPKPSPQLQPHLQWDWWRSHMAVNQRDENCSWL